MNRIFSLVLIGIAVVFSGCESHQMVKDSWKFTKRQYSTYLNTPASLDLDDRGSCEVYELALGEAVMNVDAELQKLVRVMENSDHNPDPAWVMSIMSRVPWLSGVALVDGEGALVAQYPEQLAKDFEIAPLLEKDPKQRQGALRAYVQQHAAGPEVYIANPVYGGDELRGLIVAFFDPAALATMSNDPGSFVLASPVGVIWPGRYAGGAMTGVDWADKLTRESCGIVGGRDAGFFWTTRYVGNLPLVYGMPVSASPTSFVPAAATGEQEPVPAAQDSPQAPAPAAQESPALEQFPTDAVPASDREGGADARKDEAGDARQSKKFPSPQTQDPWHGHDPGHQNPAVMNAPGGM